jgi:hypothetical protein
MIIVEGPDGGGKSTLVQKLAEDLGLPVSERIVSKDAEMMGDLEQWVNENLNAGMQAMIFDRHRLISEPIYGPVLREKPQPGFDDWYWVKESLRRFYLMDPFLIYCIPPFKTVLDNLQYDENNEVVQNNIRTIYWLYFYQCMRDINHPFCLRYDYTALDVPESNYAGVLVSARDWLRQRVRHHEYPHR